MDWSEASPGDALFDLATLMLAHEDHLDDVLSGYGADVDRDVIRAWRSWRCLTAIRGLFESATARPRTTPRSPYFDHTREAAPPRSAPRTPSGVFLLRLSPAVKELMSLGYSLLREQIGVGQRAGIGVCTLAVVTLALA
jgi:hypothetical protein